jgi:hypothetical protein
MVTLTLDSFQIGAIIFLVLFFLFILYTFASSGGFSKGRQEGFEAGLESAKYKDEKNHNHTRQTIY